MMFYSKSEVYFSVVDLLKEKKPRPFLLPFVVY
jgi:hypothetical protein